MRPAHSCEIIDLKDLRVTPASLRLRKIIITASVCYIFLFTPILGYVVWNYTMAQPHLEEFEIDRDSNTTRCSTVRGLPSHRRIFPFQHRALNPRAHPRPAVLRKYAVLEKIRHAEDVTAKVLTASFQATRHDTTSSLGIIVSSAPAVENVSGTRTPGSDDVRELLARNRPKHFLANLPVKLARQEEGVISDVTENVPNGSFHEITEQAILAETARVVEHNLRWITRVPNLDFPVVPGRYINADGGFRRRRPVYLPENRTLDEIREKQEERLMRRLRNYRRRAVLSEDPRLSGSSRIDVGFQERESNRVPEQVFGEQRGGRKRPNEESNEVLSLSDFFKKHWTSLKKNIHSARRSMNGKVRRRTERGNEHGSERGKKRGRQLVINYLSSSANDTAKAARVREFPIGLEPEDWPRKGSVTTVRTTRVRYNDFQHSYLVPRGKDWDFYAPLKSSEEKSWEDDVREQAFYSPKPLSDLPWSEVEASSLLTSSNEEQQSSSETFAQYNATNVLYGNSTVSESNTEGIGRESAAGNSSTLNDTLPVDINMEVRKNMSVLDLLPGGAPVQTTPTHIKRQFITGVMSGVQHGPVVSDKITSGIHGKNVSSNGEATLEPSKANRDGLRTESPTMARTDTIPAFFQKLKTGAESKDSGHTKIVQDLLPGKSRTSGSAGGDSVGSSASSLLTVVASSANNTSDHPVTDAIEASMADPYSTSNSSNVSNQSAVGADVVRTSGADSYENASDHSVSSTDVVRSSSTPGTLSGKDVSFKDLAYQSNEVVTIREFSEDEGGLRPTSNSSMPAVVTVSSAKDFAMSETTDHQGLSRATGIGGITDLESNATARGTTRALDGGTEQQATDGRVGNLSLKEDGLPTAKSFGRAVQVEDNYTGTAQQIEHSSDGPSLLTTSSAESALQDSKQPTVVTSIVKTLTAGNKGNEVSKASSSEAATTVGELSHEYTTTKTELTIPAERQKKAGVSEESSGTALRMATSDTGKQNSSTLISWSEQSGTAVRTETSATPTQDPRNVSRGKTVDAETQPIPASKSPSELPDNGRSLRSMSTQHATDEQTHSSMLQTATYSSEVPAIQNSTVSNVPEASTTPPRTDISAGNISASSTRTSIKTATGTVSTRQSSSMSSRVPSVGLEAASAENEGITTSSQQSGTSSVAHEKDISPSQSGGLGGKSSALSLMSGKSSPGTPGSQTASSSRLQQETVTRDYRDGAVVTQQTTVTTSEAVPTTRRPVEETAAMRSSSPLVVRTAGPTGSLDKASSVGTSIHLEEPAKTASIHPESSKDTRQGPDGSAGRTIRGGTEEEDAGIHFPTRRIMRTDEKLTTARHVGIFDMFAGGGSRHGFRYRRRKSWRQGTTPPGPPQPVQVTLFGGGFYARTVDAVRISVRRGKKIVHD